MENNLPDRFNLGQATDNVLKLKEDVGKGIIALGQWIALVKEKLPKTEWLDWLKYEVKISKTTAYLWIRVSQEFTYKDLETVGSGKLFELLEIPAGMDRDELLEKAPNLTEKELRQEIEAKKAVQLTEQDGELPEDGIEQLDPQIEKTVRRYLDLLDGLDQINIDAIPPNFKDFLIRQLTMIKRDIEGFLLALEDARAKE